MNEDELLGKEEESNPKEYCKLHCLNLDFLDMKSQEKKIQPILLSHSLILILD